MLRSKTLLIRPTLMLLAILLVGCCEAQQTAANTHPQGIKSFLKKYLYNPTSAVDPSTHFIVATIYGSKGLNGEIVVYLSGESWCGTGGCTLLVLEPQGDAFKVIGRTSIVKLPIRLLSTSSNGYPDLGVWVQGGGVREGYEARLRFDGEHYPKNPSTAPAMPIPMSSNGKDLIARGDEGIPLY